MRPTQNKNEIKLLVPPYEQYLKRHYAAMGDRSSERQVQDVQIELLLCENDILENP